MTKKEKAMELARTAGIRARQNAQKNKRDLIRKAASAGSAYLYGMATKPRTNADGTPMLNPNGTPQRGTDYIPDIMGMPRSVTVAAATQVLSMVMPPGLIRESVAGIADSTTAIALFQFGARTDPQAQIRGVRGASVVSEARRLEAQLRNLDNSGARSAREEVNA